MADLTVPGLPPECWAGLIAQWHDALAARRRKVRPAGRPGPFPDDPPEAAWRERAQAAYAALGRVWDLAAAWDQRGGDEATVPGRMYRGLAADLRAAVVARPGHDALQDPLK